MHRRSLGFTLLEILIVLIILGVIAGIAVPNLGNHVERSRAQEAYHRLTLLRESLTRYHAQNNTYVGATIAPAGFIGTLDFNPHDMSGGGGGATLFLYTFSAGPTPTTYTVRAVRQAFAGCGASIGTISINQAGIVTATGAYF